MEKWMTVIEPKTKLFDLPLKEIWRYRNLIYRLVKRNYEIQYKQTILGPAWMIFNLVLSSGLFSFIFGYVGNFSSENIPYFLFYMSGSVLWNFFSGCVMNNTRILLDNAYLFGKVYFPRLVVPVSNTLFELIRFIVQMLICCCAWGFYYIRGETRFMGAYLLLIPLLVLETGILGTAMGILISALTTKYRDLTHLVGFGMQLLMYASPILYPVSQFPVQLQRLLLLNPMASVIEGFRYAVTGSGQLRWGYLIYSVVFSFLIGMGSLLLFNQVEKTFIDIV